MADALASGASEGNLVGVQVPPRPRRNPRSAGVSSRGERGSPLPISGCPIEASERRHADRGFVIGALRCVVSDLAVNVPAPSHRGWLAKGHGGNEQEMVDTVRPIGAGGRGSCRRFFVATRTGTDTGTGGSGRRAGDGVCSRVLRRRHVVVRPAVPKRSSRRSQRVWEDMRRAQPRWRANGMCVHIGKRSCGCACVSNGRCPGTPG
jgi:hypothetical protein